MLSAREERCVRTVNNKIRENPRLSAPKLRGIVENTTRKTMSCQTIRRMLHKYDFHCRKVQQQMKDVW
jgi:Transposase.